MCVYVVYLSVSLHQRYCVVYKVSWVIQPLLGITMDCNMNRSTYPSLNHAQIVLTETDAPGFGTKPDYLHCIYCAWIKSLLPSNKHGKRRTACLQTRLIFLLDLRCLTPQIFRPATGCSPSRTTRYRHRHRRLLR